MPWRPASNERYPRPFWQVAWITEKRQECDNMPADDKQLIEAATVVVRLLNTPVLRGPP